jgi:Zn-dependent protease
MDSGVLLERLLYLVPMVLSLTVHECAHAWSAFRLGDDTASRLGRLTLNPLAHIDPLGTLLLPLLGVPFGWARPVPVDPTRFTRRVSLRTGWALTAAAGPLSNLLLALACAVAIGLMHRLAPERLAGGGADVALLGIALRMNVNLALFNLLPVPPLDGSRIAERLLPTRLEQAWRRFAAASPLLLLAVFAFGGSILAGPSAFALRLLGRLVGAVAGA